MKKLSIKSWALDDRPREKILLKGKENVSDAELIAILWLWKQKRKCGRFTQTYLKSS